MSDYYNVVKRYLREKWSNDASIKKRIVQYYYEELEKLLMFLIPKDISIMEIGCSNGSLLKKLKPKEAIGAYLVTEHIKNQETKNIEFIEGVPEEIPDMGKTFDYLLFFNSIGYIEDIEKTVQQAKKFCNNDSRIIITYYNYLWEPLFSLLETIGLKEKQRLRQSWISISDISNILSLTDFEVVEKDKFMIIPFYIPLLSIFLNKYCSRLPLLRKLCLVEYIIARPMAKKKEEYSVSVLIAARNEAGTIEDAVKRIPKLGSHTEIIFVEGHSKDKTRDEIKRIISKYKEKDIKLFVQDGKGKGDAVRKGFDHAKGDILMILDADLTVVPEELTKFYDAIASGKGEFINGSRLVYPMENEAMRTLNIIGNKGFSMLFSWLLNQRIKDTLCGTKVLFRKDYLKIKAGREYFGDFDPFGDFDLLFGAAKLHLKIIEIPVRYKNRVYGTTNIQRFAHGWLLIRMCIFATKKLKFV